MESLPLKIDFHVHTIYSHDGLISFKQLARQIRKTGLDGVAITDHDTIKGALTFLEKSKSYDFLIIPGVEITARGAHIVALNVYEDISAGLSIEETVELVHEAGGLAVLAHPITIHKGVKRLLRGEIFDAVEVINASSFPFLFSVSRSKAFAKKFGLVEVAGSDAHYFEEVGSAYTLVNSNLSIESVIEAIRKNAVTPCGGRIPFGIRLKREALVLKRKFSQ